MWEVSFLHSVRRLWNNSTESMNKGSTERRERLIPIQRLEGVQVKILNSKEIHIQFSRWVLTLNTHIYGKTAPWVAPNEDKGNSLPLKVKIGRRQRAWWIGIPPSSLGLCAGERALEKGSTGCRRCSISSCRSLVRNWSSGNRTKLSGYPSGTTLLELERLIWINKSRGRSEGL